jgi:tetratricopeptide (TPR) repeat protein
MTRDEENSEDKSVDLVLLKKEVDALQVAVHGQRAPWYKNIPTIISVVALLFSFGTTFVSYQRTQSQDIQNARVELRGLLQRLASLPRENIEITKKYEQIDPAAVNMISSSLNQENSLLARQAAEIAKKLPSGSVSATEYYSIGFALQNAYNLEDARELFTKAIDVSTDLNDRVGALRGRASLLFMTGQPDAGRVDFQRALSVFSDFRNTSYNEYTKRSTHIWTELGWAYAEANIGAKDIALQHVENAEEYLSGLIAGPGESQLRSQIHQARSLISGTNDLTIPLSVPQLNATTPLSGVH